MDDVERLKDEVREGRIDADRLIDLVVTLQRHLPDARRRIAELEKKLGSALELTQWVVEVHFDTQSTSLRRHIRYDRSVSSQFRTIRGSTAPKLICAVLNGLDSAPAAGYSTLACGGANGLVNDRGSK